MEIRSYTKTIIYILLLLSLSSISCAGWGEIKEWEVINNDGIPTLKLKTLWEFKGRNIKGKTSEGAEIETQTSSGMKLLEKIEVN